MKVIETNHDGQNTYNSLEEFAANVLADLGPENVLDLYLEGEDLQKFYDFANQTEDEQKRLMGCFEQDFTFEIVE